jgi:hypothetical protein
MSPNILSTYVEWRNLRLEALTENSKIDWWPVAMVNENSWHLWFLDGILESETMLSRSALARIYYNVKAKTTLTSPSIRSKRSLLVLHRARNARIQFKTADLFLLPDAAARSENEVPPKRRNLIGAFDCTKRQQQSFSLVL